MIEVRHDPWEEAERLTGGYFAEHFDGGRTEAVLVLEGADQLILLGCDQVATILRQQGGWSLAKLAEAFGVAKSTAARWTDPHSRAQSRRSAREWKRRHRRPQTHAHTPCPYCKAPMGRGSSMCLDCRRAVQTARDDLLIGMWLADWSAREIAQTLGLTRKAIWAAVARLRMRNPEAVPYR